MQGQRGFWDVEDRLKQLSAEGDPLEKLNVTVDFEMFRPLLGKAVGRADASKGGRPGAEVQDAGAAGNAWIVAASD